MNDLISRKDLMKKIAHHTVHDSMSYVTFERSTVYEMVKGDMFGLVKDAPAVAAIPRWISVEERLPEEGCWVLCWYKRWDNSSWHTVGRINPFDGGWELDVGHGLENKNKVTHWMPLPEPPKED